jgi:hypothetical protein
VIVKAMETVDKMDSLFAVYFFQRKLLVNFLTFSKILDEVAKISCLEMVMLKRRFKIIDDAIGRHNS